MTVIPTEIGVVGTFTKELVGGLEEMEIRGRVATIKTTVLLRSAGILRRVLVDLRRLGTTQNPVRNHLLRLV